MWLGYWHLTSYYVISLFPGALLNLFDMCGEGGGVSNPNLVFCVDCGAHFFSGGSSSMYFCAYIHGTHIPRGVGCGCFWTGAVLCVCEN